MADVFSAAKRSEIMARIKGKNTVPEIRVGQLIRALGHRFRVCDFALPGKPDIVIPKLKKVIFVHGCFWHGHNRCRRSTLPATRKNFWREKIEGNKLRDRRITGRLRRLGWGVLVVWQCEL